MSNERDWINFHLLLESFFIIVLILFLIFSNSKRIQFMFYKSYNIESFLLEMEYKDQINLISWRELRKEGPAVYLNINCKIL